MALVVGLPEDSAVWRQDKPTWTLQDELLALNAEVVDARMRDLLSVTVQAASGKRPKLGEPLKITHVGRGNAPAPKPRSKKIDPEAVTRFFGPVGR